MQARRQGLVLDDHARPVGGEGVEGRHRPPYGGVGRPVGEGAVAPPSLQTVHPRGGAGGAVADPVDLAQGPSADDGHTTLQSICQPGQHSGAPRVRPHRIRRRRQRRQHAVQVQKQGGPSIDDRRLGQA
ncbi:hypothetical protein D3C86_1478500 [compost metagenome]